jgi:membrane protein implicated in regulation of membrane protease activity
VTDEPYERTPPVGEEIHMPGPSLLPIISAAAVTAIVIGTTINWIFSIAGAVVLLICLYRWVSDVNRDIAELPEEHQH